MTINHGCFKSEMDPYPHLSKIKLVTPYDDEVVIHLAITPEDMTQGLSGKPEKDFPENHGMLFLYSHEGPRRFWMPDTHFDLDIYFLDRNLTVLDVEKNVPHHKGRGGPLPIYQTQVYLAMHVLEFKSSSPISKKIKKGDTFKWHESNSKSLSQILPSIHPVQ
jgi:hypothetical protein